MRLKFLLILILSFTVLAGCGKTSVQNDIINYVNNELPKISVLERDAIAEYERVSGDNFQNDAVMYSSLVEIVIPKYKSFLEGLEKINPKTKDLKVVHEIYVKSAKDQLEGFDMVLEALERQDPNLITEANKYLDSGRTGIEEFLSKLMELADKNNVDIN